MAFADSFFVCYRISVREFYLKKEAARNKKEFFRHIIMKRTKQNRQIAHNSQQKHGTKLKLMPFTWESSDVTQIKRIYFKVQHVSLNIAADARIRPRWMNEIKKKMSLEQHEKQKMKRLYFKLLTTVKKLIKWIKVIIKLTKVI